MILGDNKAEMNELVRIEAQQSMMYILPDSTKVWMKPGSSIQYTKAFNKERKDGPSSDISGDTGRGRECQKGQQRQQIN